MFKKTHPDLILTAPDRTRSIWKMPEKYFSNTNNLFMSLLKWEDEKNCLIKSPSIGQECILDAENNQDIIKWAIELIENHGNH